MNLGFVNGYWLLVFEGLLFLLAFGGLTQIRREGLTTQFIIESMGITILAVLASLGAAQPIHPLAFLVVIYLATMRVRLTIDLANWLARSGRGRLAMRLYALASLLGPDPSGQVLIDVNRAALLLIVGRAADVIPTLESVLAHASETHLGFKHEAVARYNLGQAYLTEGRESDAVEQFDAVMSLWPGSRYAERAESALLGRHRSSPTDNRRP
jgi:hypothetical protein